jgi:hypothetical protein
MPPPDVVAFINAVFPTAVTVPVVVAGMLALFV